MVAKQIAKVLMTLIVACRVLADVERRLFDSIMYCELAKNPVA